LESELRLLIAILGIALLGGCDRQKPAEPQGGEPAAQPESGKGIDRSHSGAAAPAAEFRDPDGEPVTLAKFAGKPLLLNLWATWCAPCVKELPTLDALDGRGRPIGVVTLSQDSGDQAKVRDFLAQHGLKRLEAWQDPKMAMTAALGVQILPTSILFDRNGRELWRYSGDLDWTGAEAERLLTDVR
jgi:thiol-disulfide isomerase/thioredoxin